MHSKEKGFSYKGKEFIRNVDYFNSLDKRKIMNLINRLTREESFTYKGKKYIKGIDYHCTNDKKLIKQYGEKNLDFVPSTPPEFR